LADGRNVAVNFSVEDCNSRTWIHNRYDGIAAIFVQFAGPPMRERLFRNMMHSLKPGCRTSTKMIPLHSRIEAFVTKGYWPTRSRGDQLGTSNGQGCAGPMVCWHSA
jgi:hypothetical protein